ncbi:MAG TPA: ABC transporter ATP-binding protein [Actinomycetota bacterium]|nr:ABC transporter ATP-binding protein [Actinomycetota bacterium]
MDKRPAFDVHNLRKRYRDPDVLANDGLTFSCYQGEAFGLLGPNGAGKTTLVRQLVGLLRPTAGEITLFGEAVRPGHPVGSRVAYLPQGSLSLGELKVAEAVAWTAILRGCGKATAVAERDELIETLELTSIAARPIRKLSGGQRRLTQIALTLAGRLPVVILDEPTTDVDPSLRRRVWSLISRRAREGTAVVLVTHDVAEAEKALDRVAIMSGGRIVAAGTPSELKAHLAHRTRLEVAVAEGSSTTPAEIAGVFANGAKTDGRRVSAWVPADEAIAMLEKITTSFPADALEDVRLVTPTLEDAYLELSGHYLEEQR